MGLFKRMGEMLGVGAALAGGAGAAEAGPSHHDAIVGAEQSAHVEKMESPEKALYEGAKFAAEEAARQEEGGGIEKDPKSVFESSKGAKVHFEATTGAAAKWGEVIAIVALPDGQERKFVLSKKKSDDKGASPEYDVRAPLSDIETMESEVASNE